MGWSFGVLLAGMLRGGINPLFNISLLTSVKDYLWLLSGGLGVAAIIISL